MQLCHRQVIRAGSVFRWKKIPIVPIPELPLKPWPSPSSPLTRSAGRPPPSIELAAVLFTPAPWVDPYLLHGMQRIRPPPSEQPGAGAPPLSYRTTPRSRHGRRTVTTSSSCQLAVQPAEFRRRNRVRRRPNRGPRFARADSFSGCSTGRSRAEGAGAKAA